MQRKFLEDLGLEKNVIDKIMDENGNDINSTKQRLEGERDNYKSQLETAQETLKGFDGVDVNELQGKITALQNDLTAKETEYQNKLADRDFNDKFNSLIAKNGGRNSKAIMALLDIDNIKSSKNQDADLQTAIEALKADNDYLFESQEPFKNPVAPTGKSNITGTTKEMFEKMTYSERIALKKDSPQKYKELKGE